MTAIDLENDRFLRLSEVERLVSLSRDQISRLENEGRFPRGLNLGSRSVRWLESEVGRWLDREKPVHGCPNSFKMCGTRIYVMGSLSLFKIGVSSDVSARLACVRSANPHNVTLLWAYDVPEGSAYIIERAVHRDLATHRCSSEWFKAPERLIRSTIERQIERAQRYRRAA